MEIKSGVLSLKGEGPFNPTPGFTYMNGNVYFYNYDHIEDNFNLYYRQYLYRMPFNGNSPVPIKALSGTLSFGMINFNNALYTIDRLYEDRGMMIIKSDGTEAGTVEFIDNYKSTLGSNPQRMFSLNGYTFFSTNMSEYGNELPQIWRTNGTPEGTIKLGTTGMFTPRAVIGTYLYFITISNTVWQLWKTNGTTSSTVMIRQSDASGYYYETIPQKMVNVNGKLYYSTANGQLWRSDGTSAGTKMIHAFKGIVDLFGANGRAQVIAYEFNGTALYRADATGAYFISYLVHFPQPNDYVYPSINIGNVLYFVTQDGFSGNELWRTDGTRNGTYKIKDFRTGNGTPESGVYRTIKRLILHNNNLYVSAIDNEGDGEQYLWKLTGLRSLEKVKKISDKNMVSHNGLLYIWGIDTRDGQGNVLEVTDGTASGFKILAELEATAAFDYGIVGDIIYFAGYFDSPKGTGLWRTDGTECGTFQVSSDPGNHRYEMEGLGTSLIFAGPTATLGVEPYVYKNINELVTSPCVATTAMATPSVVEPIIITIYPNPYTQDFSIRFNDDLNKEAEISIYNSMGIPVETLKGVKANTDYEHLGVNWPKGIYIVKVNKSGKISTYTIIKN